MENGMSDGDKSMTDLEKGQSGVAVETGVSKRTVRKWEHGHACPTEDHWQALAHILRLDSTFPKT